jgi:hypothetical protein
MMQRANFAEDRSCDSRGPAHALNLRAQNLTLFLQIADGVDLDTLQHHRSAGQHSSRSGDVVKDVEWAKRTAAIFSDGSISAAESRAEVRAIVEKRHTAPAEN